MTKVGSSEAFATIHCVLLSVLGKSNPVHHVKGRLSSFSRSLNHTFPSPPALSVSVVCCVVFFWYLLRSEVSGPRPHWGLALVLGPLHEADCGCLKKSWAIAGWSRDRDAHPQWDRDNASISWQPNIHQLIPFKNKILCWAHPSLFSLTLLTHISPGWPCLVARPPSVWRVSPNLVH